MGKGAGCRCLDGFHMRNPQESVIKVMGSTNYS